MQIFHIRRWVIRMLYSVVDLGRQAVMECWRHTVSVEMPERSVRPAVLVIPGGGYSYISDRECEPPSEDSRPFQAERKQPADASGGSGEL